MPRITTTIGEEGPSPDGALITTPNGWLVDATGNVFSLVRSPDKGMQIRVNVLIDQVTANVQLLMMDQGRCYQRNQAGDWYGYNGQPGAWQQVARPSPPDPPKPPVTEGIYRVENGRILAPDGSRWHGRGVCLRHLNWPDNLNCIMQHPIASHDACTPLVQSFPGINLVRYDCFESMAQFGAAQPDAIIPYVDAIIGQGITTIIECHVFPTTLSGGDLDAVCGWYAELAEYYKGQPLVCWETQNEPGWAPDEEICRIHDAIRGTGNENLIAMCITGGWSFQDMNPANYTRLRNVCWDHHAYGWESGYSTDQATVDRHLQSMIDQGMSYHSADGPIPMTVLEFSPCGYQNSNSYFNGQCWVDPNGAQVINAVFRNQQLCAWTGWLWNTPETSQDNGIGHLIALSGLDGSELTGDWGVQCREAIAAGAPY